MMLMKRNILTGGGLALAVVLLLAINILAGTLFSSARLDLTANKLYTLSDGTRKILAGLDEPITLRLYLSKRLVTRLPGISGYAQRVRALLDEYQRAAGGNLNVHVIDPEPFSPEEDRAVGYGLRGIPLSGGQDTFYFGLVGTSSTDQQSVLPYLSRERARFLEYDLTKLIYTLAHPEKPVVGVISSLPLDGRRGIQMGMPAGQPWVIMEQMRQLYEVRMLDPKLTRIPETIKTLMLVHPKGLSDATLYAIDQYVLGGGHALVFVDPDAEADRSRAPGGMPIPGRRSSQLGRLLKSWGLDLDTGKVVGDLKLAAKVRMQRGGRIATFDYPVWINVQPALLDRGDIVTGDLGNLAFGTAGALVPRSDATTTIKVLARTATDATLFDVSKVADRADPEALVRDYRSGGKSLNLAVRVTGKVKTAFPDGAPPLPEGKQAKAGKSAKPLSESATDVNLIVVADSDMLSDRFWVNVQSFLGSRLAVPTAANGTFVINALDNLLGSNDLISVRNRGAFLRPFDRVNDLRRSADARFRSKERELRTRLKATEDKLVALEQKKQGKQALILTPAQQREIAQFRQQKLRIRKELRGVQSDLRADIDRLETWVKFVNIGLVPLLIGFGALLIGGWRMRRRGHPAARA